MALNIQRLKSQIVKKQELEKSISDYKLFYKKYLSQIRNRRGLLDSLTSLCSEFKSKEPRQFLLKDNHSVIDGKAQRLLSNYFDKKLLELYNKEIHHKRDKEVLYEDSDPFFIKALVSVASSIERVEDKYKREWDYKTNFLVHLKNCLSDFGLHPYILWRNKQLFKRFNILIHHFYRSKKQMVDYKILMNHDEFDSFFVNPYKKQARIKIGGKLIPFQSIHEVKITTTLLLDDEIELFAAKHQFSWNPDNKEILKFINSCEDETEQLHPNPFEEEKDTSSKSNWNYSLFEETKKMLVKFPKPQELYVAAYEKYQMKSNERNILDDLRLSLELLLKEILNNGKSLENQLSTIGKYQKEKGASSEVTNMFHRLLNYYAKYQNEYVKHDNKVKVNEIEFVFELTSSFMKFLIK